MNLKKTVTSLGRVLMVVSIGFIVLKIWRYQDDLIDSLSFPVVAFGIVGSILWGLCVCFVQPIPFAKFVNLMTGKKVCYQKIFYLYNKSNLYKYLPGNVMQYVGRNQLAVEEALSHKEIAFASLAEIILTCVSACALAVILSFSDMINWLKGILTVQIILLGSFLLLAVILLAVFFNKKLKKFLLPFRNCLSKEGLKVLFISIFVFVSILLVNGGLCLTAIGMFHGKAFAGPILKMLGISILAWLLGFITPGAPGGIGIREFALNFFFAAYFPENVILLGVLLFRIVTTLGDILAYAFSLITAFLNSYFGGTHNDSVGEVK